ncbi:MAG: Crp/Fnr family transcriptional regulator [Acidiphilium sp. 34-60-192]|nr:MAG: Crp/Fnr family transcriptional regulator [Acidiphilium sp. 34-60-192]
MPDDLSIVRRGPINVAAELSATLCAKCEARHVGLCDALDDADLHFLAGVARRSTANRGQVFITEGDPARQFFNINHGTAKLYKDLPDGRRQIIGSEALEPIQYCRFDRTELRGVFGRFPIIERRLLDVASHELVIAQEQMLLLGRKTAVERVASFLDGWRNRAAPCANPTAALDLPMSRSELADFLGLTIETVSRALAALRKQNIVSIGSDHRIAILKPTRLTAISQAAE